MDGGGPLVAVAVDPLSDSKPVGRENGLGRMMTKWQTSLASTTRTAPQLSKMSQ